MRLVFIATEMEFKPGRYNLEVEAEIIGEMVAVKPGGLSELERKMLEYALQRDAEKKEESR